MIVEVDLNNIDIISNEFIKKDTIKNELNNNPFGKYLIYKNNSDIIGYLYYSDIYDRCEKNQFEVDFIHRNCGIGTKLLKKLTEIVDKSITLEVKVDNYSAIKIYKKFNFVEKAIRKGYYDGVDGYLMERSV